MSQEEDIPSSLTQVDKTMWFYFSPKMDNPKRLLGIVDELGQPIKRAILETLKGTKEKNYENV